MKKLVNLKNFHSVPPTLAELAEIAKDGAEAWADKAQCLLLGVAYAHRKRGYNPNRPIKSKTLDLLRNKGEELWTGIMLSGVVPVPFIAHPDVESVRRLYETLSLRLSDVFGPDPDPWTRPVFKDIGPVLDEPFPESPGPGADLDELGETIRAMHAQIECDQARLAAACPGHSWSPWRQEISVDLDDLSDSEDGLREAAEWMHGGSRYVWRHCYVCGKSEIRILRDPADVDKARETVRTWLRDNAPDLPADWESRELARARFAELDAKFSAGADGFADPDKIIGDWTPGDPFGGVNDICSP